MTDLIAKELTDIIREPTVLMRKDGVPPEYNGSQKYRRMKVRQIGRISVNMISYLLMRGADRSSIERFSSGDFESFLSMSNAYKQG